MWRIEDAILTKHHIAGGSENFHMGALACGVWGECGVYGKTLVGGLRTKFFRRWISLQTLFTYFYCRDNQNVKMSNNLLLKLVCYTVGAKQHFGGVDPQTHSWNPHCSSIPFSILLSPFLFPSPQFSHICYIVTFSSYLPLSVAKWPLKLARWSGERWNLPAMSGQSPAAKPFWWIYFNLFYSLIAWVPRVRFFYNK